MRLRPATLLVVAVACTSCQCSSEITVLGADGDSRIELFEYEELGCAGAGGHGIALVWPEMKQRSQRRAYGDFGDLQSLDVMGVHCSSPGELDASAEPWVLSCDDLTYHLYSVPQDAHMVALGRENDDAKEPFWEVADELVSAHPYGPLPNAVFERAAELGHLNEALISAGDTRNYAWTAQFEALSAEDQSTVLDALAKRISPDTEAWMAFARLQRYRPSIDEKTWNERWAAVRAWVDMPRETSLSVVSQSMQQDGKDQHRRGGYDLLMWDAVRLGLGDRVHETYCEAYESEICDDGCLAIWAQSPELSCPAIAQRARVALCEPGAWCDEDICVPEAELGTEARAARDAHARAARVARDGLLSRSDPEVDLASQRVRYEVIRAEKGCWQDGPAEAPCNCLGATQLQRRACMAPNDATEILDHNCITTINDESRSLTTVRSKTVGLAPMIDTDAGAIESDTGVVPAADIGASNDGGSTPPRNSQDPR